MFVVFVTGGAALGAIYLGLLTDQLGAKWMLPASAAVVLIALDVPEPPRPRPISLLLACCHATETQCRTN